MDIISYILAKKYTDNTVNGGGAIKGKNCTIDSITPITNGNRVTFKWTLDDGTVQTNTMDVINGEIGPVGPAGKGIASMAVNASNHIIITYTDGTTEDVGVVPGDIQPDWEQTNNANLDYIKNKPSVVAGVGENSVLIGHGVYNEASHSNAISIGGGLARGVNSVAIGGGKAYAYNSYAEGTSYAGTVDSDPTGTVSNNDDGRGSHAEGAAGFAYGNVSHVEGMSNITHGLGSHAEGYNSQAGNDEYDFGAHAEGVGNHAYNRAAHAEGESTQATGQRSHSEGNSTIASGNNSHAEGNSTTASSVNSHAEGNGTTASGDNSHAEGNSTNAKSANTHAEGSSTWAQAQNAHAEGNDAHANGFASHAEGSHTYATGQDSHAENSYCTASGISSHAEGNATNANGSNSHAGGYASTSTAINSFTHGNTVIANNENQASFGKFNSQVLSTENPDAYTVFAVGNGTASNNRSNAFEVRSNNEVYCNDIKLLKDGEAINYSTTEKVIGTWVNGKPLYSKSYIITSGITFGDTYNYVNLDSGIKVRRYEGNIARTNGAVDGFVYGYQNFDLDKVSMMDIRPGQIEFLINSVLETNFEYAFFNIQYTKDAD